MEIRKISLRIGCLLFCFYTSISYGMPSDYGSGYFNVSSFNNYEWHIDQDGYAVVDKADLSLRVNTVTNPCLSAFNLVAGIGRFVSCRVERELCGARCEYSKLFESTNINALSVAQLRNLLSATGKMAYVGSAQQGSMIFILSVSGTSGSSNNYLPKQRGGGGGGVEGIPITPVEPPTSCLASSTTLDHKTLSVADLQGNIATGNLTISCNKAAGVRLRINGYSHSSGLALTDDRSLISHLTLNGAPADSDLNVSVPSWQAATVVVYSILEKTGTTVTPGTYSKALIVLMTID
ncbi:hypothetical protein M2407_002981 [Serratia sp. BIGb0234]|uniref:MrpH family fimbial adhesin n=1 Tax=Serratia sp. BIGb0234 TaxID=2940614 RepID=UPI002166E802|nr:hypothetical protein [Serratia sp. BIGb0234]MCS4318641.1 hypothetical protein [Serratia sp. BIGb0234]